MAMRLRTTSSSSNLNYNNICEHTKNGKDQKGEIVTFINGILNSKDGCRKSAELLAEELNARVYYIHDPSNGFTRDILAAGGSMADLYESQAADKLVKVWRYFIHNQKVIIIYHHAHSRGSLVTKQALKKLRPEEQQKIQVTTYGGPARISDKNCKNVKMIENEYDPVPYTNPNNVASSVMNSVWSLGSGIGSGIKSMLGMNDDNSSQNNNNGNKVIIKSSVAVDQHSLKTYKMGMKKMK